MTSMSVKGASFLLTDLSVNVNFAGNKGVPAAENAGKIVGFGDLINRAAANKPGENQSAAPAAKAEAAAPAKFKDREAQAVSERQSGEKAGAAGETAKSPAPEETKEETKSVTEAKNETKNAAPDETAAGNEALTEKVAEAAAEVLNIVAAEIGILPEEALEILAALQMTKESLLTVTNLGEAVAALTASDPLLLVTDENLYESFTNLTEEIKTVTGELLKDLNLSPEELKALADAEEIKLVPDKLTESVNLTNETAATKMAEPEQKITFAAEKDGVITEIIARADEKGHLGAIKEVTTSEVKAAPEVIIETKADAADEQPRQSPEQGGGKNPSGHETLFNSLLQNRSSSVEPQLEPVMTAPTPSTTQIMQQILDYMKIQLSPEIDRLEMQLHPASLGTVGVKIAANNGIITAQFTAQNETVKAAIESQLGELRESMRTQGIKVESVEVNVESQAFDSNLWQGQNERQDEQDTGKNRRRLNLSGLDLTELPEDLTEDEKLAAEMMIENGQTVDFTA